MMSKTKLVVIMMVLLLLTAGISCRLASPAEETPVPPDTQQPSPTATAVPEVIEVPPTAVSEPLRQWGSAADTGGYFDEGSLALGEPVKRDCQYFPSDSAWIYQGETRDPEAYLQIFYEQPVVPTQVNIHLVYYFSGIVSVSLVELDGVAHEVYTAEPGMLDECPVVLTVDVDDFTKPVNAVRMDVAMDDPNAWEITAIEATVELETDTYYTVLAVGDGVNQDLGLIPLVDDLTEPEAGKFHLRLGHLAPFESGEAVLADVRVRGVEEPLAENVDFGDVTAFIALDADEYDLIITAAGDETNILIDPAPETFAEGDIVSAFATGDGDNQDLGVFAMPAGEIGFFLPLVVEEVLGFYLAPAVPI